MRLGPYWLQKAYIPLLQNQLARVVYAWSKRKHENILELLGLAEVREELALISPWMHGWTASFYIKTVATVNRCQMVGPEYFVLLLSILNLTN